MRNGRFLRYDGVHPDAVIGVCSGAEALTDAPFVDLEPQSSSLEIFELAQVPIGPAALESIAEACPRLRQLNLSGNNAALGSSTAMEAVGRHCGSLRSLNASGSIMVRAPWGDATVYALLSHSNLIMLKLINCSYSTLTAEGCVTLLRSSTAFSLSLSCCACVDVGARTDVCRA